MTGLLLSVIYLSFISLGLPDSLLGAAWPSMYRELNVPVSYSGIVSMIISVGTIVSSLQSDRLTKRLGPGKVTAISVAMTAAALLGFSFSGSFPALCLLSIPYGLGAGRVDAALNNYVALHYSSRHMSWLHCMWGVGASVGPYIMGYALTRGSGWNQGYFIVALLQFLLSAILISSLSLWNRQGNGSQNQIKSPETKVSETSGEEIRGTMDIGPAALSLRQIFSIPGAKSLITAFFCYMALETTASLWASSYLTFEKEIPSASAASYAGLFFIGITLGRAISGFLTMKLSDTSMIRLGGGIIGLGLISLLLPLGKASSLLGLSLMGLGCAPIYPCIIHSTPVYFGAERSQAVIGVQMASAYVGSCLMPPLFGVLGNHLGLFLYPPVLLIFLALMMLMHEKLVKIKP